MTIKDYRAEAAEGIRLALESASVEQVDALAQAIVEAPRVFFTAAGRSFLLLKTLAMALAQIGKVVHVAGEVTTPNISHGDLLVVASSSGSTASVALFVEQAAAEGARVALITARPSSPIAEKSDIVVVLGTGVAEGQTRWETGSFFELAIAALGDAIVEGIAPALGAFNATVAANHANLE